MNVVGAPIVHRDAYTLLVEREINSYFREAIFNPLFAVLEANNVPIDPKFQAIKDDELGARLNAEPWTLFPRSFYSLGLERSEMPQIPSDSRGALIQFLASRGVTYQIGPMPATALKPTQAGYYPDKVRKAEESDGDRAILAAADGYILDGHHQWFAAIEAGESVKVMMFDMRIRPLLALVLELPSAERANAATSALREALRTGRVHYADGVFSGSFSAAISKELRDLGATFDKPAKSFRLPEARIPLDLRGALAEATLRSKTVHEEILTTLDVMAPNIGAAALGLSFGRQVDAIVGDLQKQLVRTVSGLEGISVAPDVTPEIRKALDEKLTFNLDLAIKDFAQERIPELRKRVEENLFAGGRSDRLAEIIEAEFGVTRRKANFLADQETGLLVSKFREERYAEVGVQDYIWSTSGDLRVRPDHAALNGRRFSFRSPPVVDRASGRRANPGEDFRCRCTARPVFSVNKAA